MKVNQAYNWSKSWLRHCTVQYIYMSPASPGGGVVEREHWDLMEPNFLIYLFLEEQLLHSFVR